jgi:hypothetical protein
VEFCFIYLLIHAWSWLHFWNDLVIFTFDFGNEQQSYHCQYLFAEVELVAGSPLAMEFRMKKWAFFSPKNQDSKHYKGGDRVGKRDVTRAARGASPFTWKTWVFTRNNFLKLKTSGFLSMNCSQLLDLGCGNNIPIWNSKRYEVISKLLDPTRHIHTYTLSRRCKRWH